MERYKHGGQVYDKKVKLDFSANVNPLGLPNEVKHAVEKSLEFSQRYPDDTCRALREAIAFREHVKEEQVICGNGASDLIFRIVHAKKPKNALVMAPTFSEYEKALESVECNIRYYRLTKEQDFCLTNDLLEVLHRDIDIMFLCNPNNPVGNLIKPNLLEQIVLKCKQEEIFLVLDECFLDFVCEGERYSGKKYLENCNNLFLLKAFTKFYGMAGLRLGYGLCSSQDVIEKMIKHGPSWNVSTPAQTAGLEALKQFEYEKRTKKLIQEEREYLYQELIKIGYTVYKPSANYIFFQAEEGLYSKMLEKEILVRCCDNYIGLSNTYYRIAVRTHEENEEFIKVLKQIKEK